MPEGNKSYQSLIQAKESPLYQMQEPLAFQILVLTRELTKVFEEVIRGKTSDIINKLEGRQIKGEITLLLSGKIDKNKTDDTFYNESIERIPEKD